MFIAKKPCSFGPGHSYLIGDEIPDGVVAPDAVKRLTKAGIIVQVSEEQPAQEAAKPITIKVKVNEGVLELTPTPEGLQSIFDILNSNADQATDVVAEMTDNDALLLLHITDDRKTIKTAAEERAKELAPAPEPEEESEEEPEEESEEVGDQ